MSSRRLTALITAVGLAATGLAACGDDEQDAATPPPPPAATQTDAAGETVEVAAEPGGELAYLQDSLTAPAGSVTFAFTNQAAVPHDLNIEKDGEQVEGTEVITESEADLTVDLEPGQYTFYCSVANHREEGMEGELTVE